MICHVMECHVMECHVIGCHVTGCHVIACHVIGCHIIGCHVTGCRVIGCCITCATRVRYALHELASNLCVSLGGGEFANPPTAHRARGMVSIPAGGRHRYHSGAADALPGAHQAKKTASAGGVLQASAVCFPPSSLHTSASCFSNSVLLDRQR